MTYLINLAEKRQYQEVQVCIIDLVIQKEYNSSISFSSLVVTLIGTDQRNDYSIHKVWSAERKIFNANGLIKGNV